MAQYCTEAIILSVRNWGEADKIVTFLSRDLGKVKAVAYGCRRPRSPLAGGMQIFSRLQLQATTGGQLDTIKQCETKRSFKELRENLDFMAYASFLAEYVGEICPERHPEPQIYEILIAALALFSEKNPRIVALAAAYQLLECTGYQPDYQHCGVCHKRIEEDGCFSHHVGGAVCVGCADGSEENFPLSVQILIGNFLSLDWRRPESFKISGAALLQSERLLLTYIGHFLERPLKSLAFIQQLMALPK